MSRNRFDKLLKYFHLNNNANRLPHEDVNYDKLFKVWSLLDRVVERCQTELRPERDLSVDEAMIKFKGRLGMKQYMPMKPIKQGIKVWECTEASSGLVCNFLVYTGKKTRWRGRTQLGLSCCFRFNSKFNGQKSPCVFTTGGTSEGFDQ